MPITRGSDITNFQRLFHIGWLVSDISAAMDNYAATLNLRWAKPYTFEALPLWSPGKGIEHLRLSVTYSVEGPQHIELLTGPPGSFYDPKLRSGFHVGLWVDDVASEVAALLAQDWTVLLAGASPAEGYGTFVYLTSPAGGPMVELISTALAPAFDRWWSGGDFY